MSKSFRHRVLIAFAAAGLAGAAMAQTAAVPPEQPTDAALGGVTITAPRVIEHKLYGTSEAMMALSVRVKFRDLNMGTPEGVAELDRRVAEAADYACRQLGILYPDARPDQPMCERETLSGAQPQVALARTVR